MQATMLCGLHLLCVHVHVTNLVVIIMEHDDNDYVENFLNAKIMDTHCDTNKTLSLSLKLSLSL